MPEQSLSSKYFCIIVLHDCVPKQLASISESNDSIYLFIIIINDSICSLWGASFFLSYMKIIKFRGFSYFCKDI